jgi:ATP-dependent Clp protease ATP-binding subunit ClpA
MFERFSGAARDVVVRAREEAKRLDHHYIGTEHLLLALLDDQSGRTATVLRRRGLTAAGVRDAIGRHTKASEVLGAADADALRSIGIDLDAVRAKVEATFGPDALRPPTPVRRGLFRKGFDTDRLTRRAAKTLELALRYAIHQGSKVITTDHLLLGILREGEGLAVKIMVAAGINVTDLRDDLTGGAGKVA